MAKDHGPSVKGDEKYEALRRQGATKEKAARIANSPHEAWTGGKAPPYDAWNKDDLYPRAQELGIEGRSHMTKQELVTALRKN